MERTTRRLSLLGYAVALAGPVLVTLVQLEIGDLQTPLISYFFVVLMVSVCFNLGAALLATCCAAVASNYFFLRPVGQFSFSGTAGHHMLFSTIMMIAASCMIYALRRNAARLQKSQQLAEERRLEAVKARREQEKLAADLQEALRARDDFLAVAGHELKTPLTAMSLQAQILQKRVLDGTYEGPRLIDPIKKHAQEVSRLSNLVDELLDVSRITAGRVELHREPCDLASLVHDIGERFAASAARSRCALTLRCAAGAAGHWDRMRLEQIVSNLVSNALKYGAGRPVELVVRTSREHAVIDVIDHGRGIDLRDQERIFQRYERSSPNRQVGGLGLGLWIARELAIAMGGTITVKSELGVGSMFSLHLPLDHQPEAVDGTLDSVQHAS